MKYVILDRMSETEKGYKDKNIQELIPVDWITRAYVCLVSGGWEVAVDIRDPMNPESVYDDKSLDRLYRNTGYPDMKTFAERKLAELQKELSA